MSAERARHGSASGGTGPGRSSPRKAAGAAASPPGVVSIGEAARRTGVRASALRFYESVGLLRAARSSGGRRYYERAELRRIAFIRAAQNVGISLDEIRDALASLPGERAPKKEDWERLSRGWRDILDARIAALERLRDTLGECIGCGCLSLRACALYNPKDVAARFGPGARYLMGDSAMDVVGRAKRRT